MSDITIQIPFTIHALPGETDAQTAARMDLGLKAAVCYLNRKGKPFAQIGDGPLGEQERVAAVDALTSEQRIGIVLEELASHVRQLVLAEGAERDEIAKQATQAQREALVATLG